MLGQGIVLGEKLVDDQGARPAVEHEMVAGPDEFVGAIACANEGKAVEGSLR